jgi:hypothetical protein
MITTQEAHEAPLMFSKGPGFLTWRAATLSAEMSYVFVNYGLKEGRLWIYQTSILWDSNDVLTFCQRLKANKFAKIVDISLLQPVRRVKKLTWHWIKILEVRSYVSDSAQHPVYISEAGEAVGLTPAEAGQKTTLICKIPRNAA